MKYLFSLLLLLTTYLAYTQVEAGISAGESYSLFLKTDGTVWATGSNFSGQLGNGTNSSEYSPIQVASGIKAIATGRSHSLFLRTDGTVWATGDNLFGQLGDGTTTDRNTLYKLLLE
ncbi:MAG: hypothetical protein QE277_02860 [Flectobacillus sp.]|nr:hypothetical protein [Flectobacillus sp.]